MEGNVSVETKLFLRLRATLCSIIHELKSVGCMELSFMVVCKRFFLPTYLPSIAGYIARSYSLECKNCF